MKIGMPRLLRKAASKLAKNRNTDILFSGDDEMFKRLASQSKRYGEYGMGASTLWVLANTQAEVVAVDTAQQWVENVKANAKASDQARLNAKWIDVGDVGMAGRPKSFAKRSSFEDYVTSIWKSASDMDLILVDGRFRVCCFLQSLLSAAPGTRILFDDYTKRPHYHLVEEFVRRDQECGRQCLFTVPEQLDRDAITALRDRFLYVMD
jgi:hypothetical protein